MILNITTVMRRGLALGTLLIGLCALPAAAQELLLDEFERSEGLLLFRSYDDPLKYYYVPNRPQVAVGEEGKPEFSFMKYARNVASEGDEGGIQESGGGGVVHFLVTYGVPRGSVEKAQQALQEKVEGAWIAGPVLFRSGRFMLVTTIASEGGRFANKVVGIGKAPLIEGARAAVSIDLNPEGASLLWESFKMDNPDISILFDMEVAGFRKPYEATMEVEWDKVYRDDEVSAGLKVFWVGAEVDATIERLRQEGAIKLLVKGESASMDAVVQRAHAKMLELMFAPVSPPEEKSGEAGDLLSAASALIGKRSKGKSSWWPFSLHASYKMKDIKRSGKAKMDFGHFSSESINMTMAGNIGDLYARFGDDKNVFRSTNLDDPVFKQREVFVTIDGRSEKDFADYVNFVTVAMRKRHENGEETIREVVIDEKKFKDQRNRFKMVYGWKGDNDRSRWLSYEYRTVWNFRQGIQVKGEWRETDTFVINVLPPYEYRRISLEADPDIFEENGIRHALVKFYYRFFGQEIPLQGVVRVKGGSAVAKLEYVCESGNFDYDYEVKWYRKGGQHLYQSRRSDSSEILYVDELPEDGPSSGGN
jgi:hypothetical protein